MRFIRFLVFVAFAAAGVWLALQPEMPAILARMPGFGKLDPAYQLGAVAAAYVLLALCLLRRRPKRTTPDGMAMAEKAPEFDANGRRIAELPVKKRINVVSELVGDYASKFPIPNNADASEIIRYLKEEMTCEWWQATSVDTATRRQMRNEIYDQLNSDETWADEDEGDMFDISRQILSDFVLAAFHAPPVRPLATTPPVGGMAEAE